MKRKPHPETCERCPNRYSEHGCPAWVRAEQGIIEEDPNVPGSARVTTGCMWPHLPRWLAHGIAAGNRSAAAIESNRNAMDKTLKGFRSSVLAAIEAFRKDMARVNRVMVALQMQRDGQMLPGMEEKRVIEHKPGDVSN